MMGVLIALGGITAAMFHKRGWISPLFVGLAVLLFHLIDFIFGILLSISLAAFDLTAILEKYPYLWILLGITAFVSTLLVMFAIQISLPKIDHRRMPKVSKIPYSLLSYVILLLTIVGGIVGVGAIVAASDVADVSVESEEMKSASTTLGAYLALGAIAHVACSRLGKMKTKARQDRKVIAEGKAPILFLRSFEFQRMKTSKELNWTAGIITPSPSHTFEEDLSSSFSKTNPLIALGNPDDYLPSPGAYKLYQSDDKWHEYAGNLILVSHAILLVEGQTPGLKWEMEFIRRKCDPGKLLILTPPRGIRKALLKGTKGLGWRVFSEILHSTGYQPFQNDPGPGALIAFDEDWTPRIVAQGLKNGKAFAKEIKKRIPEASPNFNPSVLQAILAAGIGSEESAEMRGLKGKVWLPWAAGLGTFVLLLLGFLALSLLLCWGISSAG